MSSFGSKNSRSKLLFKPGPPFDGPAPGLFLTDDEFSAARGTRFGSSWQSLLDPQSGSPALIFPGGSVYISELFRLIGGNFEPGSVTSPGQWDTFTNNGATIDDSTNILVLDTNGSIDAECSIQTQRRARFITSTFNVSHQGISLIPFDAGPDNIRRWGCFDPQNVNGNGLFFEVQDGEIFIVRRKNGTDEERIPESQFNGGNTVVKNQNAIVYEIIYNNGTALFFQNRKLIHQMLMLTDIGFNTSHLKVGHENKNINGGSAQAQLDSRGSSISRSGSGEVVPEFFRLTSSGSGIIKNSPGHLHRVVVNKTGIGATSFQLFNTQTSSGPDIADIDVRDTIATLEYQLDFDSLSYDLAGSQVDLTVIFD